MRTGWPYLLPDVGAGGPEEAFDFRGQVATHLRRTHTGQSAQGQRLHVLTTMRKVAAQEHTAINWSESESVESRNIG